MSTYDKEILTHYKKVAESQLNDDSCTMDDHITRKLETLFITKIINKEIKKQGKNKKLKISDFGCGNGFTLTKIAESFSNQEYSGFEYTNELKKIANEKENVWLAWMEKNFPDIKKNDVLTGVYKPEGQITLHHNETVVSTFNDKDFARSFFLIWLHENTSKQKLRQGLLEFREDG